MADKQWLTTGDVMKATGLNYFQVYRRIRSGKLPAVRSGEKEPYLIHARDLADYLASEKLEAEEQRLREERKSHKRWAIEDGWLTVEQVAEIAGVYPLTVRNAIKSKSKHPDAPRLHVYRDRPGGNIHIHINDVRDWLERREEWQKAKAVEAREAWERRKHRVRNIRVPEEEKHVGIKTTVSSDRWERGVSR